jgi:hypothetical protein
MTNVPPLVLGVRTVVHFLRPVSGAAGGSEGRIPPAGVARFPAPPTKELLQAIAPAKGVNVETVVHARLAPFADLIGFRIVVDGPKLHLNAAAARAIGLALHELATNAGKYGALSADVGRIDIRWGTEGDTFAISWTERNGPPVSPPMHRGFGTVVLKTLAERSVGGAAGLDYTASGTPWRLNLPCGECAGRDGDLRKRNRRRSASKLFRAKSRRFGATVIHVMVKQTAAATRALNDNSRNQPLA